MKIGIYPGSFDPLTYGHLDVIKRATKIFDKVIITVSINTSKKYMFEHDERIDIIRKVTANMKNVEIAKLEGLLVDFVDKYDDAVIVKGMRVASDFEYEFQMALLNNVLNKNVETVFLMTSSKYAYVSSTMVKEVSYFGGDISNMVPEYVAFRMKEKRGY